MTSESSLLLNSGSNALLGSSSSKGFVPARKRKLSLKALQFSDLPSEDLDKIVLTPRSSRILDSMGLTLQDLCPQTYQQIHFEDATLAKEYVNLKKEKRDERKQKLFGEVQDEYNKPDDYIDTIQKQLDEAKQKVEDGIKEEIEKLTAIRMKKKRELDILLRAEKEKFVERQRILRSLNENEASLRARQELRDQKRQNDLVLSKEEEAVKSKQREEFLEQQRLEAHKKFKDREEGYEKQLHTHEEQKAQQHEANRQKMVERMENIKKGVDDAKEREEERKTKIEKLRENLTERSLGVLINQRNELQKRIQEEKEKELQKLKEREKALLDEEANKEKRRRNDEEEDRKGREYLEKKREEERLKRVEEDERLLGKLEGINRQKRIEAYSREEQRKRDLKDQMLREELERRKLDLLRAKKDTEIQLEADRLELQQALEIFRVTGVWNPPAWVREVGGGGSDVPEELPGEDTEKAKQILLKNSTTSSITRPKTLASLHEKKKSISKLEKKKAETSSGAAGEGTQEGEAAAEPEVTNTDLTEKTPAELTTSTGEN